ncbi:MAG: threonylcarbamoyl-AMP synthase [Candidatus Buchananbacteria bacterium]|nr:threonylcarbamoyl-AMP synthase [Candidatus Buchananbacteria bacterium]
MVYQKDQVQEITDQINKGAIGVLPTDTLYGVVASIKQLEAVERVYTVKQRDRHKACIVLIAKLDDLQLFGITVDEYRDRLNEYWPGPVSVVLPTGTCPEHLCRKGPSLAVRFPNDPWLQSLLALTGPLIAPSANPETQPPATTIAEAQQYFNSDIDFYVDGGILAGKASTLISLVEPETTTLRA